MTTFNPGDRVSVTCDGCGHAPKFTGETFTFSYRVGNTWMTVRDERTGQAFTLYARTHRVELDGTR